MGLNGGDVWSGVRASNDEISELIDGACSTTVGSPIIPQYYPARQWLWRQWGGTIIRRVLPREVLLNVITALSISYFFRATMSATQRAAIAASLTAVEKVWVTLSSLVSFTLSFFLSQSYSLWRAVYSTTRRVQGRLNDLSLLCATYAERDQATGRYTKRAEDLLAVVARYVRLFNILLYASVTRRFAPLKTPQGLSGLVRAGVVTPSERDVRPTSGIRPVGSEHNATTTSR